MMLVSISFPLYDCVALYEKYFFIFIRNNISLGVSDRCTNGGNMINF